MGLRGGPLVAGRRFAPNLIHEDGRGGSSLKNVSTTGPLWS